MKLPMHYIQVQRYIPTNTRRVKSGLVAFADKTYFQLWKNDYLFFENSAKYYAIIVPVMKK